MCGSSSRPSFALRACSVRTVSSKTKSAGRLPRRATAKWVASVLLPTPAEL
jgi:hypothetical protein